jgi:recombination associated protein RdgC
VIFKNVIIYKLAADIEIDLDQLAESITEHPARDPGPLEISASGFASIRTGYPDLLTFRVLDGVECALIVLEHRTRVIPPAALRHAWETEIKRVEDAEIRTLSRRERYKLKEQVFEQMLPKAFITTGRIQGMMIGPYFLVDTSSHKAAEHLIGRIRDALGSFPVVPWTLTGDVRKFLNSVRLNDNNTFQLSSQRNTALFAEQSRATVTTKDFDTQRSETSDLIANGASIERLGVCWKGEVDFVLSDDLTLRRVRFAETFKEQAYDDAGEEADREMIFEASAHIFAATMERLIGDLTSSIGDDPSDDEDL